MPNKLVAMIMSLEELEKGSRSITSNQLHTIVKIIPPDPKIIGLK